MIEAEKGILGCVLIDQSCLYDIYGKLEPEMFANEFCSDAYREMLVMYDCGKKINLMDLTQQMEGRKYDVETVAEQLKECIVSSPTSTMAKNYAGTIIKEYKARTVKELFSRVSLMPKDIEDTISECLLKLESLQKAEESGLKPIKQVVEENKGNYFIPDKPTSGIRLGYYKLDECLGDLPKGDVTVIAARPAVGKSAFVSEIIGKMCKKGLKVGYFNLEMREQQVYERFLSSIGGISLLRIKNANAFLGDEQANFDKANKQMSEYNLFISSSRRVSKIKAECRHQNFDVIVIDHLQLTQSDKAWHGNRNGEIGENSREIKAMAMSLGVHVILISQLNRAVEHRDNKEPSLADLRESGDIEQDASNIIFLWNLSDDEKYNSNKGAKVAKNRQGVLMKEGMKFDGEHMQFMERMEDFEKFKSHVKALERGTGFSNVNENNTPFGSDWDN